MTMKVFNAGAVLGSADINEYMVNTKFAVKPNAEQVTSAPNLHDDQDLILHVDASKTYHVRLFAAIGSPAAAGFSHAFTAPAGSVLYGTAKSSSGDASFGTHWVSIYDGVNSLIGATFGTLTYGGGSSDFLELDAMLVTAGTAGNFKFRWSQNNSNASATTVRAGSWLLLRRVS